MSDSNKPPKPPPPDDFSKTTPKEFAYEIVDGDQLFVIGYDEKPEIIQEWPDDSKK